MWTREILKTNAKVALKRNHWTCVIVSLILLVLGAGSSVGSAEIEFRTEELGAPDSWLWNGFVFMIIAVAVLAALVFAILVSNVLRIGGARYYMENREHKTEVEKIFHNFKEGYANSIWIMFLKELYIFGWSLLLVVPGIIKAYSYMMIPYILAENPYITKERAFEISSRMMDGHKLDAFVLELSFIGWGILSSISWGLVGILYANPYRDATFAEFYTAIKAEAFQKGITDSIELPGVSYPEFTGEFAQ